MSDSTYRLIISSPDGNIFDDDVYFLSLRGEQGDLAILKGHIPFTTPVKKGKVKIELKDSSEKYGDIESGTLIVSKERTILLSTNFKFS